MFLVAKFVFEAFAEPLFDHALVVEVAAAGDAFDAGEHAWVESQGDGGGFAHVWAVEGALHEADVELMLGPEGGFDVFVFKGWEFTPGADGFHVGRRRGKVVGDGGGGWGGG